MDLFWMARHTLTDCLTPEVFVLKKKKTGIAISWFYIKYGKWIVWKKGPPCLFSFTVDRTLKLNLPVYMFPSYFAISYLH